MIRLIAFIAGVTVSCSAISADLDLGSHRPKHTHDKEFFYGATPADPNGPLWEFTDQSISYVGGFRVSSAQQGATPRSTANLSEGVFTLSESGTSIFLVGDTGGGAAEDGDNIGSQIGELQIPALVNTTDVSQMNIAGVVQNFSFFNDFFRPEGRYNAGIHPNQFRVTGMHAIGGKLIVNYFNFYGEDPDTTAIFQDSQNLATTDIVGPFRMQGASKSGGWISPVPAEWQTRLGATHVSGWSQGSIDGRLSIGPSAYFWNPADYLDDTVETDIATTEGMNFPLNNIMFKETYRGMYDHAIDTKEWIQLNTDGRNDLWTYGSGAAYGFIIPGTNTYMVVGHSNGHESGIGYKYHRPTGPPCGGACAKDIDDYYNYFWLFKVSDIEKGLNGDIQPYSIRPYRYGKFPTIGSKAKLKGGYFNPADGKLYVSLFIGDTLSTTNRPPLFLVYQLTY